MSINKIIKVDDFANGVGCPGCNRIFLSDTAVKRVRLADAELAFCDNCGAHLGVITRSADTRKIKIA